jgi:hypothetical protein
MNFAEKFRIQVATNLPVLRTWLNKCTKKRDGERFCKVELKESHIQWLGLQWEYTQGDEKHCGCFPSLETDY